MSNLNGRVARLEATVEQAPRAAEQDPLRWHRQLVEYCLAVYSEARPGCMGMKDGECYTWAISWPRVWQFHDLLERYEVAVVPERFETADEAQRWIEWTYRQLLGFRRALEERDNEQH